jgi:hypothetical protein
VAVRDERARPGLAIDVVAAESIDAAVEFGVPPMPWLSMSLVGLRMISTRSTSSAGMRSTSTVLSLPEPEMRRPLIRIWVYSEPMPRSEGAAYSPTSSLNVTPGTRFIISPTDSGSKRWKYSSE